MYMRAWEALRFDRAYPGMGGQAPVSYLAISQYAQDNNISGDDFWIFTKLFGAIDAEWLNFVSSQSESDDQ